MLPVGEGFWRRARGLGGRVPSRRHAVSRSAHCACTAFGPRACAAGSHDPLDPDFPLSCPPPPPPDNQEGLQVLRYVNGQEYQAHYDFFWVRHGRLRGKRTGFGDRVHRKALAAFACGVFAGPS
jgi:hypothetical protein